MGGTLVVGALMGWCFFLYLGGEDGQPKPPLATVIIANILGGPIALERALQSGSGEQARSGTHGRGQGYAAAAPPTGGLAIASRRCTGP